MAFVEDFSAFFGDFATSVTIAGVSLKGIFDDPYALGNVGVSGMDSCRPTLTLPTVSVPAAVIAQLDDHSTMLDDLRFAVHGNTYQIVGHEPDGTGMSVLALEKVLA